MFFFFSSRRRHTRFDCDWSSDVCSSDLDARVAGWRRSLARAENAGGGRPGARARARRRRSEERRGGEEGRSRWAPYHLKKKKKKEEDGGDIGVMYRNEL